MEDKEKLAKLNLPDNFKKKLEIEPTTGTVSPNQEKTVEVCIFKYNLTSHWPRVSCKFSAPLSFSEKYNINIRNLMIGI